MQFCVEFYIVMFTAKPCREREIMNSTNSALVLWSVQVCSLYTHLFCPWKTVTTPGMLKLLYFWDGEFIPFILFYPDLILHSNFYASWLPFKFCCVCLVCKTLRFCSLFSANPIEYLCFLLNIWCTDTDVIFVFFSQLETHLRLLLYNKWGFIRKKMILYSYLLVKM